MKKYRHRAISFISTAVVAGGILLGCNEFLSQLPDNRTTLDSREKIARLLVSAYPSYHHAFFTEPMSDNARDKGPIPNQWVGAQYLDMNGLAYLWSDIDYVDSDTPNGYWESCYDAISSANHALWAIDELGGDTTMFAPLKGEALLARAYAHFMLVNLWGKPYDSLTAAVDLGVPYALEPERVALKDWKRNTVKEVYDFIEEDIKTGLPLLDNSEYTRPKFHFTVEAAKAFATRFYLYKGDWKKVIDYANELLSADGTHLRDWAGSYYQKATYAQLTVRYASPNEPANLLVTSVSTVYARYYAYFRYGMDVPLVETVFPASPPPVITPQGFFPWRYIVFGGQDYNRNLPKFEEYFRYSNISAGIGYPYAAFVLLSYDEVLLNRAEAYVMNDQFDLARADMALFLSKKSGSKADDPVMEVRLAELYKDHIPGTYKPFYSLSARQETYVRAIDDLRRREFMQEGLRWFDIRRFHLEVIHRFSEGGFAVLSQHDPRRELQIPESAIVRGMKPNKR